MSAEREQPAETLRLGDFDSHGTTRARYRNRWIEVEHGIPGEVVRAEVVGRQRPIGHIVEIVEPAPDRTWPPCPYFRDWDCGGCQWQQISYAGQLMYKRRHVENEMHRAGLDLTVTDIHAVSDPWRYRSTAGIALGKRIGFRRHASLAIVPLHDCPISHPLIGRLLAELNTARDGGEVPDFHGRVRLDVRVVGPPDQPSLQVLIRPAEPARGLPQAELEALTEVLARRPEVGGISLLQADDTVTALAGDLFAPANVAGRPVWLAAVSFFQTNLLLLPELIARLLLEAEPLAGKRVADVYGGVGVFGLFLARRAEEVMEIEADALAVQAGRLTAQHWGLSNIQFVAERAETVLRDTGRYHVVIVDPPRAGLMPPVSEALVQGRPPLICYVSCLAQSLARDLRQLTAAGYQVEHLELFDFYPQTYHVEVLAVLRLPAPPA